MSRQLIAIAAAAAFALVPAICWAADEPAAEKSPTAGDVERRGVLFEKLDGNSDGQIAANEVPEEQRRLFYRLVRQGDANSDGKLSRAEFLKASGETSPTPDAKSNDARPNENRPGEGRPDTGPGARPLAGGPALGMAVFLALDTNGNGTLDAAEISASTASLKKLDKNSDGEISREELRQAVPPAVMESMRAGNAGAPGNPNPENAMKRLLTQYDKNNDGKFEKSELPPRMQEQFDELDRNHDGSLDEAEARAILPRLMRRMENGNPPRPENPERARLRSENPAEQKKAEGNQ
jgi:Ca2+-binding EF-hand superfamily protein